MRRLFSILIVSMSLAALTAEVAGSTTVSLPDTIGLPGQAIDLPLYLSNGPARFISFQFELNFDPILLDTIFVDTTSSLAAKTLVGNYFPTTNHLEPGIYKVAWARGQPIGVSEGILLYLKAQIAADCPDIAIALRFNRDDFPFLLDDDEPETIDGVIWVGRPSIDSALPDTTLSAGEILTIDLDDYVSDPTNKDQELTWTVDDDGGLIVTIDQVSHLLTIEIPFGYSGTTEVALKVTDPSGLSAADTLTITVEGTSVDDDADPAVLPSSLLLRPNYPNPFNAGTTIPFGLPHQATVRIEIYNTAGRLVRQFGPTLLSAGSHRVGWDGLDSRGRAAPSGVYVCRLSAGGESAVVKLVLLR